MIAKIKVFLLVYIIRNIDRYFVCKTAFVFAGHLKRRLIMAQSITYTAVRVRYPACLEEDKKIRARGALTRFACLHSGRVLSDVENTFFLTDLEGRWVQQLLKICECEGLVATVRLLSGAFFDKLFAGEVA